MYTVPTLHVFVVDQVKEENRIEKNRKNDERLKASLARSQAPVPRRGLVCGCWMDSGCVIRGLFFRCVSLMDSGLIFGCSMDSASF